MPRHRCLKCGGNMFIESDYKEYYFKCLQCGHQLPTKNPKLENKGE